MRLSKSDLKMNTGAICPNCKTGYIWDMVDDGYIACGECDKGYTRQELNEIIRNQSDRFAASFRKQILAKLDKKASSPPGWSKTVEEIAAEYRKKGDSDEEAKSKACATAWKKHNEGMSKGWAD